MGRLRHRLLLARPGVGRAGEPPGHVGHVEPALLRDLPATRGRPLQPHLGRRRSTPARASACSGARRWRDGSPTPSATPASASRRRRFGAEVMLDLLDGRRTVATSAPSSCAEAAAVPAGAVPLRRHPRDALVARSRGPHRQAQPLAARPRPLRPRLRLLTRLEAEGEPSIAWRESRSTASVAPCSRLRRRRRSHRRSTGRRRRPLGGAERRPAIGSHQRGRHRRRPRSRRTIRTDAPRRRGRRARTTPAGVSAQAARCRRCRHVSTWRRHGSRRREFAS